MSNLKLIEVPSEIGAGTRGASLGIAAIKIAAHDFTSKFFKELPAEEVANENHLLYEPVKTPYARYIDGVSNVIERVADSVKNTLLEGKFPLVLAGDHSSSAGTISGIKMAYPNKRLGVIWVDAHADIHSPYTTPSGNMHGMPLAICLGEDNLESRVNRPEKGTVDAWEKLKNLGGITPKVDYEDLVYIAVRDTEYPENVLIKNKKIKIYTVPDMRKRGIEKVAYEALSKLDKCDLIYITFDVDSMDSKISQGTGTPVPNGITEKEAGRLLQGLVQNSKIVCFEMVEINPTLDRENLMAENAFEILVKVANMVEKQQLEKQ